MKKQIYYVNSTLLMFFFALSCCFAQSKVTHLKAIASPESVENCAGERKVIKTTVRITVNAPCVVKYRWLRSDGAVDSQAPHTLVFKKAGAQSVSTEWNLWAKSYEGWQALEVLSPNALTSNKAAFKIYCNQTTVPQNCEEDCLGFNPKNLTINTDIADKYRVVDGNHAMFSLRNKEQAQTAIRIIQHYNMNEICFVGRPGDLGKNVIMYFKTNGQAPQGSLANEDCISFNPNSVEAKLINGRWKVVDGNHWMFDFGTDAKAKDSAHKTVCIIKKYGFTKTCYVGRAFTDDGNGMIYMKK